MGKNAQLDNLVGSLDQLVYASFVVAYILDGNLLGLVVRCIGASMYHVILHRILLKQSNLRTAQLQFSSPKTHHPERSLTFHFGACLLVNLSTLLYHLFMPLVASPRGMIIDFIGSSESYMTRWCGASEAEAYTRPAAKQATLDNPRPSYHCYARPGPRADLRTRTLWR